MTERIETTPERCCGECAHWKRNVVYGVRAGKCQSKHFYHQQVKVFLQTLRTDYCDDFIQRSRDAQKSIDKNTEPR